MKKYLLTSFLLVILCNHAAFAKATILEQLTEVNTYWQDNYCDLDFLDSELQLTSEVQLIQTHLFCVENTLRKRNMNHLNESQKINRLKCLDILRDYYSQAVFPKNLYHKERTPYFIDDFGTACAVGYLIIQTGHQDLAYKISEENNYAYIRDLNYPELVSWAVENGFSIAELKWIQPTYGCVYSVCANNTKRDVSCYGGYDGCLGNPTPSLPNPPYMYSWFRQDATSGNWYTIFQTCDLTAGNYKCVINDSNGGTEELFITIDQPDSISTTTQISHENGTCNGAATLVPAGGIPPYTFYWSHDGSTSASISGLCSGTYSATITDYSNCVKNISVEIESTVSLQDLNENIQFNIYPNPGSGLFRIESEINSSCIFIVTDISGKEVLHSSFGNKITELDLQSFENGIYTLKIIDDNGLLLGARKVLISK